jgi:hypothetical protein
MKKLYTEKQYNEYCEHLDKIANEDLLMENVNAYLDLKDWETTISTAALKQMEERVEKEFNGEIPELKRIK